jgi:hypothetical protein
MPKSCKNVEDIKNPLEINKIILFYHSETMDKLVELYEIPEFRDVTEFLVNIANKYKFFMKVKYFKIRKIFQIQKEQAEKSFKT